MQIHELNEAAAITANDYGVVDNGTATRKFKLNDQIDARVNAVTTTMPRRRGTVGAGVDLNTLNSYDHFGVYYVTAGNNNGNRPDGITWGFLEVVAGNTGGSVMQRMTNTLGTARRFYSSDAWGAWTIVLNTTMDTKIAEAIAPLPQRRGTLATGTDLDNLNSTDFFGVYYVSSANSHQHLPDGITWGQLEVITGNAAGSVMQRITNTLGTARRFLSSGEWSGWYIEYVNKTATYSYKGLTISVRRKGKVCEIKVSGTTSSSFDADSKYETICTLDPEFYPTATNAGTYYAQVSRTRKAQFNISTAGVVQIGYGAIIATDANDDLAGITMYVSRTYLCV